MIRVSGWEEGMNSMHFIMIVREFTAITLAEAKTVLDQIREGACVELTPYEPGQSQAFADKLRNWQVPLHVEVLPESLPTET